MVPASCAPILCSYICKDTLIPVTYIRKGRAMRAARVERYGPPECISIVDAPIPEPGTGEVLVRVEASAVTSGDARLRSGRFPRGFRVPGRLALGIRGPRARTPGVVLAGSVERTGAGVSGFEPGDPVARIT